MENPVYFAMSANVTFFVFIFHLSSVISVPQRQELQDFCHAFIYTDPVYQMKHWKINKVTGNKTGFMNVLQKGRSENVTFAETGFLY